MDDQPRPSQADESIFPDASFSPKHKPGSPRQASPLQAGVAIVLALLVFGFFWAKAKYVRDEFKPGDTHYQQGNYAAAETDFRKFTQDQLTADAGAGYGHYYLGICLLQEGKLEEAQAEIHFAIDYSGGGGKTGGSEWWYYKGKRLLAAMKELPADPTTAQREQWMAKYPELFHPN